MRRARAFTLAELLVALGIGALVVGLLVLTFGQSGSWLRTLRARTDELETLHRGMAKVVRVLTTGHVYLVDRDGVLGRSEGNAMLHLERFVGRYRTHRSEVVRLTPNGLVRQTMPAHPAVVESPAGEADSAPTAPALQPVVVEEEVLSPRVGSVTFRWLPDDQLEITLQGKWSALRTTVAGPHRVRGGVEP